MYSLCVSYSKAHFKCLPDNITQYPQRFILAGQRRFERTVTTLELVHCGTNSQGLVTRKFVKASQFPERMWKWLDWIREGSWTQFLRFSPQSVNSILFTSSQLQFYKEITTESIFLIVLVPVKVFSNIMWELVSSMGYSHSKTAPHLSLGPLWCLPQWNQNLSRKNVIHSDPY